VLSSRDAGIASSDIQGFDAKDIASGNKCRRPETKLIDIIRSVVRILYKHRNYLTKREEEKNNKSTRSLAGVEGEVDGIDEVA
jgi:hypothetical protein